MNREEGMFATANVFNKLGYYTIPVDKNSKPTMAYKNLMKQPPLSLQDMIEKSGSSCVGYQLISNTDVLTLDLDGLKSDSVLPRILGAFGINLDYAWFWRTSIKAGGSVGFHVALKVNGYSDFIKEGKAKEVHLYNPNENVMGDSFKQVEIKRNHACLGPFTVNRKTGQWYHPEWMNLDTPLHEISVIEFLSAISVICESDSSYTILKEEPKGVTQTTANLNMISRRLTKEFMSEYNEDDMLTQEQMSEDFLTILPEVLNRLQTTLNARIESIKSAKDGLRYQTRNNAAFEIGGLCASYVKKTGHKVYKDALISAAMLNTEKDEKEINRQITYAFRDGVKNKYAFPKDLFGIGNNGQSDNPAEKDVPEDITLDMIMRPRSVNETLAKVHTLAKRKYLFYPFWKEGQLACMFGYTGGGKSMVAVQMANCIAAE